MAQAERPTTPTVPGTPSTATSTQPAKPRAVQKFIRGADGKIRVMYVTEQGVPIPPQAIQAGQYDIGTSDTSNYYGQGTPAAAPPKPGSAMSGNGEVNHGKDFLDQVAAITGRDPTTNPFYPGNPGNSGSSDRTTPAPGPTGAPMAADNYGYIDKPGWMGPAAAVAPGMVGAGLKVANAAINTNNVAAVNQGRQAIGLEPTGFVDTVKGVMKDNQGQVGDIALGGEEYSVGFEAMSPAGNTNLTPQEARMRQELVGQIQEIDPRSTAVNAAIQPADIAGILSGQAMTAPVSPVQPGGALPPATPTEQAPAAPAPAENPYDRPNGFTQLGADLRNGTTQFSTVPENYVDPVSSARERAQAKVDEAKAGMGASWQEKLGYGAPGTRPDMGTKPYSGTQTQIDPSQGQFGTGFANGWVDLTPQDAGTLPTPTTQAPSTNAAPVTGATQPGSMLNSPIGGPGLPNAPGTQPGFLDGAPTDPGKKSVGGTGFANLMGSVRDLGTTVNDYLGEVSSYKSTPASYTYDSLGDKRAREVSPTYESVVSGIVGGVLGPGAVVDTVSGDINPEDKAWNEKTNPNNPKSGTYSSSGRHTHNLGADIKVRDPITGDYVDLTKDDVIRNDLAMSYAATDPKVGLGWGTGYMGPSTMHVDFAGKGGLWGASSKPGSQTWSPQDRKNIAFAREYGIGPTPRVDLDKRGAYPTERPTPTDEELEGVTPAQAVAGRYGVESVTRSSLNQTDFEQATAAQMAASGLISRTPEEKAAIGRTLAGEMDQSTLEGLKRGDPRAIAEFDSMMASVENRAASKQFGNLANTLTASQYNSLKTQPLKPGQLAPIETTNANYAKYKEAIDQAIESFLSPDDGPSTGNLRASHYYNPEEAAPNWGSQLSAVTDIGPHRFGELVGDPRATQSPGFEKTKKDIEKNIGFQGAQPQTNYSGSGASGISLATATNRYDTPSEKNAKSRAEVNKAAEATSMRSEATEAAKESAKADKEKSEKSEKADKGESNKSEKSENNKSDKADKGESNHSKERERDDSL